MKASPSLLAWTGTNRLAVIANVDGNAGYTTISTDGQSTPASWKGWTGEETIGTATDVYALGASFSRDGTVSAVVRQAASTPPEVWVGPAGQGKRLKHVEKKKKGGDTAEL